jgi:hypothetical protein
MKKNSSAMFIAVIVMALTGIVIMNTVQERNRPKTNAEMEAAEEKAAAEREKANQNKAPEILPNATAEGSDESDLVLQEGEKILGDPASEHEMIFAYEWTPELQGNPTQLNQIMGAMKQMPKMRVRVVNSDGDESVAPGVYMDGQKIADNPLDPGTPSKMQMAMSHIVGK